LFLSENDALLKERGEEGKQRRQTKKKKRSVALFQCLQKENNQCSEFTCLIQCGEGKNDVSSPSRMLEKTNQVFMLPILQSGDNITPKG